jgi:cytochrome c biogenesis protein CcdA
MTGTSRKDSESLCDLVEKKTRAYFYFRWAMIFGFVGWGSFFIAGALFALGHYTMAYYVGGFSIFMGWFVSGYFWLRYGLTMGKSVKDIILRRK